MPSDRSRRTDRPRHGYTGIVAQQGRVILDRDFNANQGFTAARIAADALDFVGPCGTPDDGFRISLPGGSPPEFWSPPVAPPPESPPVSIGGGSDFLISPGTMYVGGQRAEFFPWQDGGAIAYSYFDQPDFLDPPQPSRDLRRELIYLDLTEQEVSAVEDPDLLEVALGGPDTTQRLKLLRRVRRMPVQAAGCIAAWDAAVKRWKEAGWNFDPATMQLIPAARLRVGFIQDASAADPCDPVVTGGYLGADNQLIRVHLAGSVADPKLLWGYDNASFLYPVTVTDPSTLKLAYAPPDAQHIPQTKQLVEILQTATVLASELNESGAAGAQPILRVVAEADGILRRLAQPYNPDTGTVALEHPLPATVVQSTLPLFLRIWQAELPLDPTELKDPVTGTTTGVTVTITAPGTPASGAFWQIAVRPATPQGAYPEALLTSPQPPDGPRRWVCPLAVIDWTTGTVTDCRDQFDNLVTLTARKQGCCTVTIGPQDAADSSLQTLLDRAAARAASVIVCLLPGTYKLPATLRLTPRHSNMTIECCGGPALLRADDAAAPAAFTDGLILLAGTRRASLRGLNLLVPYLPLGTQTQLAELYSGCALHAVSAPALTLEDCTFTFPEPAADFVFLTSSGVLLQGNCSGLAVRRCNFEAEIESSFHSMQTSDSLTYSENPEIADRITETEGQPQVQAAPEAQAASEALKTALGRFNATFVLASAPAAKATRQFARINAAIDLLKVPQAAQQEEVQTQAEEEKRSRIVTTVGIMAIDYPGDQAGDADPAGGQPALDCLLGQAEIRENSFTNLGFATMFAAAAETLRLQDNLVTGCVAGLWYMTPDVAPPDAPAQGSAIYYPQCLQFYEFVLLYLLALAKPPPDVPVTNAADGGDLTLLVTGNQVDPTGSSNTAAGAAGALVLVLNGVPTAPPASGPVPLPSCVIANNRLRNLGGRMTPAALLTTPAQMPCAITGNIILNITLEYVTETGAATTTPSQVPGPSLWLIVSDTLHNGTGLLSVTGNVLSGGSDLQLLNRALTNPSSTWASYNANPY